MNHEKTSDGHYIVSRAWKEITKKLPQRDFSSWTGPEVTAESGTFKLDWYASDSEESLTIYDDGIWQFYGRDGDVEGKVMKLHDLRWRNRLVKDGVPATVAHFEVMYFKGLLGKV